MRVVAFDPGLSGAVSILEDGDVIFCADLPTVGDGPRRRIDAVNLGETIRQRNPYEFAVVERVNAFPGQGVSSTFRFGQSLGTIIGVLGALLIPLHLVSPAKWKKMMGLNSDGEVSRTRAIDAWPHRADWFKRKLDHNRAESALLGLYGIKFL